ncbi:hypothetical protein AC1031_010176 [Aphanomyces cochlioides]|nr:hypothetical protein AC1031_010176 [Aphanomyces cochlioides]
MTEKWRADCAAQKELQRLIDEEHITGESSPSYVRSLSPAIFSPFTDAVFNVHLRTTKLANNLMNTAKRGKGAIKHVAIVDPKEDISFLSGKRRHEAVAASQEFGKVENPSSLVCEYFDCTTREKFVGVAICLMWGVKACTIKVTPIDLDTAIVTYKWPQQLASVEKKLEQQLESSTQKMRIYAKMQAFAAAFE